MTLVNTTTSKLPSHPRLTIPVFIHEYQSHTYRPKFHDDPPTDCETALFIVFDGGTQCHFSSVKVVLYCDTDATAQHTLGIRQGPVIQSLTGRAHRAPPNDITPPRLEISFRAVRCCSTRDCYDLVFQLHSDDKLPLRERGHTLPPHCILLEWEYSVTPDTFFLSVVLCHSNRLHSSPSPLKFPYPHPHDQFFHDVDPEECVSGVRVVRVIPCYSSSDDVAPSCPTKTVFRLPMELLLDIFADAAADSSEWQRNLLSFAQVCRQWLCAMRIFFTRLESSKEILETCTLAKALRETPALGLVFQSLDLNQHNDAWGCCQRHYFTWVKQSRFFPSLITILCATTNLQHLHLSLGYSSPANPFYSDLPELSNLRTLSIHRPKGLREYRYYSISTVQLVRYLDRWPTLTSLTVEHLKPGNIGTMDLLFLQPPACTLVQLCIRHSHISDKDLLYLTASSADTLAQVTLEGVRGVTQDGLHTFTDKTCRNVTSMTIRDVVLRRKGPVKRVVGALVDKVWCL